MGTVIAEYSKRNSIAIPYRCQDKPSTFTLPQVQIEELRNYAVVNSLKRSYISTTPAPHFSLGISSYVQCTSPIRRYIDLLTHHQLISFLDGKRLLANFELTTIIDTYLSNIREANEIMKEDKRYWQKILLIRSNSIINAYFIKWINLKIGLALLYFYDYGFEYIIKLITNNSIEQAQLLKLKVSPEYYELEDYNNSLNMYIIN
tara:strand:- start:186 stop:797 length:612 start_codon:yes stop_codon:yes gene_type:complete